MKPEHLRFVHSGGLFDGRRFDCRDRKVEIGLQFTDKLYWNFQVWWGPTRTVPISGSTAFLEWHSTSKAQSRKEHLPERHTEKGNFLFFYYSSTKSIKCSYIQQCSSLKKLQRTETGQADFLQLGQLLLKDKTAQEETPLQQYASATCDGIQWSRRRRTTEHSLRTFCAYQPPNGMLNEKQHL